ncbi:peptidoglycan-binding domain-containing protein [Devosia sp.]|uniref:peptidoglycan-binding domain-containing protein n=1 Tax=Devosia sp. TaxID=1871048 RepID=UPI002AFE4A8B|nr:peptidoglycan-binding domain-containing protein [Devosia sp.]
MKSIGLAFVFLAALGGSAQSSDASFLMNAPIAGALPPLYRQAEPANVVRVAQNSPIYDMMSKQERRTLQRALADLGFYQGSVDGDFGQGSWAAAASFQGSIGAQRTGILSADQIQQLKAAAGEVGAASPAPAPVSLGFAGLPTLEGAVLLASGTNSALGNVLGDGSYRAYQSNWDRFGRVLILASDPTLLEDPRMTSFFVPLLDIDEVEPFISPFHAQRFRESGMYYQSGTDWRGDNQFAQEDSRTAFLAKFRDKLLAQLPSFPLKVAMVRSINYGRYADGELGIEISSTTVFPHYSGHGLEAPEPFRQPTKWALDMDAARTIIETPTSLEYDFPVAVTQAVISGARRDGNRTVLDITAQSISVYSSVLMQNKIGEIPLPGAAVKSALQTPHAFDGPFPLDPVYVRMLLARERPEFADTDSFRHQTFEMRLAAERNIRSSNRVPPFSWPSLLPPSLVGGKGAPNADDVMALDSWFGAVKEKISDTAMLTDLCWFDVETECQLHDRRPQGSTQLLLGNLVETAISKWKYGWHGLPDGAREVTLETFPDSSVVLPFGVGGDVGGMMVLKAHPAWYGIPLPEGTIGNAALEVRITRQRILGTQSGVGFFAVEIEPVAFHYQSAGQWHDIAIPAHDPGAQAQAGGVYDILGVRLGMPKAEAEAIIASTFEGRRVKQSEIVNANNLRDADPTLAHSVLFLSPPYEFESVPDDLGIPEDIGAEAIKLYYDTTQPDQPVIAIGRILRYGERQYSNADEKVAGQPIMDGLIGKYDTPARIQEFHDYYDATVWAADEATRVRIASGDERCDVDSIFSRTDENIGRIYSGNITASCGEMLNVWFMNGKMALFLVNTTQILELQKVHAANAAAEAEAKPSAPAIKF